MRKVALFVTAIAGASAQPVVESVVNAASGVASVVNPQMIVSIHGRELASATLAAGGFPLPTELGGTSVMVGGSPAPLLYISPTQINAQVPTAVGDALDARVVVRTSSGESAPQVVGMTREGAPGIFTQDATGCGQGFVFNVHAAGSTRLNTPQNSFDPTSDWGFTILLTGLGARSSRKDGVAWEYDGGVGRSASPHVRFGIQGIHESYDAVFFRPTYEGPTPGTAGVDQVNFPLAGRQALIPRGCRVPLTTSSSSTIDASQYVNVSIRDGGGPCSEPAVADSLGTVRLETRTVIDADGASTRVTRMDAQFIRGGGIRLPIGNQFSNGRSAASPEPTFCAQAFPETLDAGTLTATGPSLGTVMLPRQQLDGVISYRRELTGESSFSGRLTIASTGAQVGAFRYDFDIPPPIRITTNIAAGMSAADPFTVEWTGGDSRSAVTIERTISTAGSRLPSLSWASARADEGSATIRFMVFPNPAEAEGSEVRIRVIQEIPQGPTEQLSPGKFNAPGLTLGGKVLWRYVWEFRGMAP